MDSYFVSREAGIERCFAKYKKGALPIAAEHQEFTVLDLLIKFLENVY